MKSSIIVTCFNNTRVSLHMSLACIRNIVAMTNPEDYELIVIDPVPNKGSHFKVENQYFEPVEIKYIQPKPDPGYSSCCNIGAKEALYDYLFFVQNDAYVHEGWLDGIKKYLDNGYDLIWPDQTPRTREYILKTKERDWFDPESLVGNRDEGLFAIKRSAWERMGGYNEDFSLLVQKEFLLRMGRVGIKTTAINKVWYTHLMAGSNMQLIDLDIKEYERRMTKDADALNK